MKKGNNIRARARVWSVFAAAIALGLIVAAPAIAQTVSSTRYGSRGPGVSTIQQLLATEPLIYPSRLVTGYFGPLTRKAVQQFQIQYGLVPDGIVGPNTAAAMNRVLAAGGTIDVRGPQMSAASLTKSDGSARISVTTDEQSRIYAYYDTKPITGNDPDVPFTLPAVSGTQVADASFAKSHDITIHDLHSGSTYYVVILAQDAVGNVSAQYLDPFTAR